MSVGQKLRSWWDKQTERTVAGRRVPKRLLPAKCASYCAMSSELRMFLHTIVLAAMINIITSIPAAPSLWKPVLIALLAMASYGLYRYGELCVRASVQLSQQLENEERDRNERLSSADRETRQVALFTKHSAHFIYYSRAFMFLLVLALIGFAGAVAYESNKGTDWKEAQAELRHFSKKLDTFVSSNGTEWTKVGAELGHLSEKLDLLRTECEEVGGEIGEEPAAPRSTSLSTHENEAPNRP